MKCIIFTLSICLIFFNSLAQAPTIIKRLQGTTIKNNLFFRIKGTESIQYKIDQDTIWRDLKDEKLFTLKKGGIHSSNPMNSVKTCNFLLLLDSVISLP